MGLKLCRDPGPGVTSAQQRSQQERSPRMSFALTVLYLWWLRPLVNWKLLGGLGVTIITLSGFFIFSMYSQRTWSSGNSKVTVARYAASSNVTAGNQDAVHSASSASRSKYSWTIPEVVGMVVAFVLVPAMTMWFNYYLYGRTKKDRKNEKEKEEAKEKRREEAKEKRREEAKEKRREEAKEKRREEAKEKRREEAKEKRREEAKEKRREEAKEKRREEAKEKRRDEEEKKTREEKVTDRRERKLERRQKDAKEKKRREEKVTDRRERKLERRREDAKEKKRREEKVTDRRERMELERRQEDAEDQRQRSWIQHWKFANLDLSAKGNSEISFNSREFNNRLQDLTLRGVEASTSESKEGKPKP